MATKTYIKFVSNSKNIKTGAISQTYTSSNTCPARCPFRNNGCYAKTGPCAIHWHKVDKGEGVNVVTPNDLKKVLETNPCTPVIRHNVAGDIAKEGTSDIDEKLVQTLMQAYKGHVVYTYTHCTTNERNLEIAREARKAGFIINFSVEKQDKAKICHEAGVNCVMAVESMSKKKRVIDGITYEQCPATIYENVQCVNCGKCWKKNRKTVITFPVHGVGKNKAKKAGFLEKL